MADQLSPQAISSAHEQLLLLGLEVFFVLALALAAQGDWGTPGLLVVLMLWAVFLFSHGDQLRALLDPILGAGGGTGRSPTTKPNIGQGGI